MPDKQLYEYAFIRFVPKVEREEFLNVGVILYCKKDQFLQAKFHIDKKRISAFSEGVDFEELEDYLNTWELISEGAENGGKIGQLDAASRFRWLTATRSTIIQSSKIHTGICAQPERVLEDLFEKYVL